MQTETPPTPGLIHAPKDHGKTARQFLESEGLIPKVPTIRSSDYGQALSDPFGYYLRRRLGIIPALSYSEAMSRGSYFHILFALYDCGDSTPIYSRMCEARTKELSNSCITLSIPLESRERILDRELQDQAMAQVWFELFKTHKVFDNATKTCTELLHQTYRKIGAELRLSWVDERHPDIQQVAQFDLLLYNKTTNKLWVVDAKTTAAPPLIRLSTCKHEFQTQHYIHALKWFLDRKILQKEYNLPADTSVGGMMHIAFLKPTLVFGMQDRSFYWASEGKRTGISGRVLKSPTHLRDQGAQCVMLDGQHTPHTIGTIDECIEALHKETGKKPEKVYTGEPSRQLYIERCMRWYKGEAEYSDNAASFIDEPPINISYTHSTVLLDYDWVTEYHARIDLIHDQATKEPNPCNYLKNIDSLRMNGKLSEYSPFYLSEPKDWPTLMQSNHFVVAHRDELTVAPLLVPHEFEGQIESLEPRQV